MNSLRSKDLVDLVTSVITEILTTGDPKDKIQVLTTYTKLIDAFKGDSTGDLDRGDEVPEGTSRVEDGLTAEIDKLRRMSYSNPGIAAIPAVQQESGCGEVVLAAASAPVPGASVNSAGDPPR